MNIEILKNQISNQCLYIFYKRVDNSVEEKQKTIVKSREK